MLLDENLNWRAHINAIENKISKSLGIIRKAKAYLNLKSLKNLYFSFVHSYLTYCNIAWASTNKTKIKKLMSKQKHACRLIFNENKFAPSHPLFVKLGALDVYKINIHQILTFMHKTKLTMTPNIFEGLFTSIQHKYATRYSKDNYNIPKATSKLTSFAIQHRGPLIWNNILPRDLKSEANQSIFKSKSKRFLLNNNGLNITELF